MDCLACFFNGRSRFTDVSVTYIVRSPVDSSSKSWNIDDISPMRGVVFYRCCSCRGVIIRSSTGGVSSSDMSGESGQVPYRPWAAGVERMYRLGSRCGRGKMMCAGFPLMAGPSPFRIPHSCWFRFVSLLGFYLNTFILPRVFVSTARDLRRWPTRDRALADSLEIR